SFDGHVLCHRMLIGPCALTTVGALTVAAAAAAAPPSTNLRRGGGLDREISHKGFPPGLQGTPGVPFLWLTTPFREGGEFCTERHAPIQGALVSRLYGLAPRGCRYGINHRLASVFRRFRS